MDRPTRAYRGSEGTFKDIGSFVSVTEISQRKLMQWKTSAFNVCQQKTDAVEDQCFQCVPTGSAQLVEVVFVVEGMSSALSETNEHRH